MKEENIKFVENAQNPVAPVVKNNNKKYSKKVTKNHDIVKRILLEDKHEGQESILKRLLELNVKVSQPTLSKYLNDIYADDSAGYWSINNESVQQESMLEEFLCKTIYCQVNNISGVKNKIFTVVISTKRGFETSLAELIYSYFENKTTTFFVIPTIGGVLIGSRYRKDLVDVKDYIRSKTFKQEIADSTDNSDD